MTPLLQVRALTKRYGHRIGCADVAFEKEVPWASVRRIWRARLERVAAWLAEEELARLLALEPTSATTPDEVRQIRIRTTAAGLEGQKNKKLRDM